MRHLRTTRQCSHSLVTAQGGNQGCSCEDSRLGPVVPWEGGDMQCWKGWPTFIALLLVVGVCSWGP